jgi:hypothetical protein
MGLSTEYFTTKSYGCTNIWQQKGNKLEIYDDAAALTTVRPLCVALAGAALRSR